MSVADSVVDGRLATLYSLRDALAAGVDAKGPQTAALAKQLRETLSEIAALENATPKGSIVDDLARRRQARGSDAAGGIAAGGEGSE